MNKTEKQFYKVFEIKKTDICKHAQYGYEGEEGTWYFCKKDGNYIQCYTRKFTKKMHLIYKGAFFN